MSADEIRRLAVDFSTKKGVYCEDLKLNELVYSTLLDYAAMVERCEERIEELGKCDNYKKNNGVCPAARGEEVNLNNCLDESCPNGSVIKELKEILKKGKTDERK